MEVTHCALCRVDDAQLLYEGRDRLLGGNETFHMVRCRRCGLIYLNPRPTLEEMDRYYPQHYEPFTRAEMAKSWYSRLAYRVAIAKRCHIASHRRSVRRALLHRFPLDRTTVPQPAAGHTGSAATHGQGLGRLLDVGCGDGDFMLGMQQRGWEVHGLDISPVAVTLARQKGLDVFQGKLLDANYPEAGFDRVTMWDVLEHLHDPEVQLARVVQLLRPGGRLVATFPNPHCLDFRLFGSAWTGLDIPRHVYVYTRPALLAMLERAGLEVVSARCVTGGQRVSTWSLEWLIEERVADERRKRTLKRIIYSRAWYWAWRPVYFVIDLLGLGSSITYTCQSIPDPAHRRPVQTAVQCGPPFSAEHSDAAQRRSAAMQGWLP